MTRLAQYLGKLIRERGGTLPSHNQWLEAKASEIRNMVYREDRLNMELINKAALVAEIERYISNYKDIVAKTDRNDSTWVDSVSMIDAKIDVLQHLLSLL